ncbi:MAG TPA: ChbG/HpnK family deacetylase [Candidatus Dormibacteraeota bacterium]|nr:ChbG/HpnK family deacetylase [Candidatus Dormibacteraeota bacterium]
MKQLVVNADDFGMSGGINTGILEAHRRGIVTSTTLLANGAAFDHAVTLAKSAPALGIGVHLNLTQGRPLSDPATIHSIVNKRGEFYSHPALLRRNALGRLRPADVHREFAAQIEKVRAAGIDITHFDGHKHVHMLPGLLEIVVALAKCSGVAGVRWASERPPKLWTLLRENGRSAAAIIGQFVRSRGLHLIAKASSAQLREAGVCFPAHFYGITQTGFLNHKQLSAILQMLRPGTSELMCHPGYVDDMAPELTRLRAERQLEVDVLTRPDTWQLVAQLGIHLINYRGLSPS